MNAIFKNPTLRVLPVLAAGFALFGCGGGGTFSPIVTSTGPEVVAISIVSPNPNTTTPGGKLQFQAVVTGTSNHAVTWGAQTLNEDLRDPLISSTGLFSSGTVGTYQITATSEADPTKSATATAIVQESNTGLTGTINARPSTR